MPLKSSYVGKSWVGMYKVKKRITDLDMTDHIAMNNAKGQEVTTVTRDKVVSFCLCDAFLPVLIFYNS